MGGPKFCSWPTWGRGFGTFQGSAGGRPGPSEMEPRIGLRARPHGMPPPPCRPPGPRGWEHRQSRGAPKPWAPATHGHLHQGTLLWSLSLAWGLAPPHPAVGCSSVWGSGPALWQHSLGVSSLGQGIATPPTSPPLPFFPYFPLPPPLPSSSSPAQEPPTPNFTDGVTG